MIRFYENNAKTDVYVLNQMQNKELINKLETKYKKGDLKRFIYKEVERWIAIDNTNADLFMEEFDSLEKTFQYLLVDDELEISKADEKTIEQLDIQLQNDIKIIFINILSEII